MWWRVPENHFPFLQMFLDCSCRASQLNKTRILAEPLAPPTLSTSALLWTLHVHVIKYTGPLFCIAWGRQAVCRYSQPYWVPGGAWLGCGNQHNVCLPMNSHIWARIEGEFVTAELNLFSYKSYGGFLLPGLELGHFNLYISFKITLYTIRKCIWL